MHQFNELYCFRFLYSEHLSCMFVSNNKKYLFHTVFHNIHAKQLTMKLPKMPTKKHAFFTHYNSNACADTDKCRIDILSRQQHQLAFRSVFLAFPSVNFFEILHTYSI